MMNTETGQLYREWRTQRAKLMSLEGKLFASIDDETGNGRDGAHSAQCEVVWALEHRIAREAPTSLDDVRLKALVVKHWMKDADSETIIDELLSSLTPGELA